MNKLTLEEYQSLYSDKITKGEYDRIIDKIDKRFLYIMETICTRLNWYDYDNGWKETNGHFEPNKYHANRNSYINFDGEYTLPPPYNTCPDIPIKWLWEDFEENFKKEVSDFKTQKEHEKIKLKNQRIELKAKKVAMKRLIQSKLSKEELKFIKFK